MLVRPEIFADAQTIDALTEAAYGQRDEADLVSALRDCGDIELSLVADEDGRRGPSTALSITRP